MSTWRNFQNYLFQKLALVRNDHATAVSLVRESFSDYSLQDITQPIFTVPEEVLLSIFSCLPPDDLATCADVCRLWARVSTDRLLWEHKLRLAARHWNSITSDVYPRPDPDTNCLPHPREIYINCSQIDRPCSPSIMQNITQLLRSMMRKKAKFAMFGPGIESKRTSRIVRKMFHDKCAELEPVGMIPGENGFGTGLTIRLTLNEESHLLDLVVLYTTLQSVRGTIDKQEDRLRSSRIFEVPPEGQGFDQMVPTQQLRHLTDSLDGLIFTVDAEESVDEIRIVRHELHTFLAAFALKGHTVPIFILSLVKQEDCHRKVTTCELVDLLDLGTISNPWYVQNCVITDSNTISRGFLWLIQKWMTA